MQRARAVLTQEDIDWTADFLKMKIGPGPEPGPDGDASGGGQPAVAGFPQPMAPDCHPVHGKVPGPKNFVLCSTHNHILDTDKNVIVAADVKGFLALHPEFGALTMPMLAGAVTKVE